MLFDAATPVRGTFDAICGVETYLRGSRYSLHRQAAQRESK
jgi:hypothetical protein